MSDEGLLEDASAQWQRAVLWQGAGPDSVDPQLAAIEQAEEAVKRARHFAKRSDVTALGDRVSNCEEVLHTVDSRLALLENEDNVRAQLHVRLVATLAAEAPKVDGVTSAFVHPKELAFVVVGAQWTPELSAAGADLAVRLQDIVAPDLSVYVGGGFEATPENAYQGWCRVWP